MDAAEGPTITLFICSSRKNFARRRAIRNTWLRLLKPPGDDSPEHQVLSPEDRARVTVRFLVSRAAATKNSDDANAANADEDDALLDAEAARHGDLFFARTPEGYDRLWTKALEYLEAQLQSDAGQRAPSFFVHADDDAYVRADLLLGVLGAAPRRRFYWGYAWNLGVGDEQRGLGEGESEGGIGRAGGEAKATTTTTLPPAPNAGAGDGGRAGTPEAATAKTTTTTTPLLLHRRTRPIRDPANKSHMPERDYPFPDYPPFCSGCCFALSRDLAEALVAGLASSGGGGAVPRRYALLDPPFGIHLCGPLPPHGRGVMTPPVVPVHDARVRPYRALPLFDGATVAQHYLRPEELAPFHARVMDGLVGGGGGGGDEDGGGAAARLYGQLVGMGLLRR